MDFGDQMWHKVAGGSAKQARDFILQDDMEECIALLAITIEVLRWLTRSTAQRLEVVNPSDMLIHTFALLASVDRSAIHLVVGLRFPIQASRGLRYPDFCWHARVVCWEAAFELSISKRTCCSSLRCAL